LSLTSKVVRGVKWSGVSQFGRQGISFITTSILAHQLSPADYGLLGMAAVFTGFLNIFTDIGTSTALIQKKDISEELLSSVFWINILFGCFIMFIVIILAPLVAIFYQEARITDILRVLSLSFLVSSLSIVHYSMLKRELNFNILAKIEIIAAVFSSITGVILAFHRFGVWSLVYQGLASTTITTLLLWLSCRWKPKMLFNRYEVLSISKFSINLVGFNTLNYFSRNGDNLLIGKYLGAQALGYYNLAYQLMLLPLQSISSVIGKVMLPAFSQLQENDSRFRASYLKLVSTIAFVSFPGMFGLWAVADNFIIVIFGAKWEPAILLLLILAPIGMLQSIGTTVGIIYQAKGRTDWMFRWGVVTSILTFLVFILGLRWGVIGVASAYAILSILVTYPLYAIPFKLINLSFSKLLVALWRPFLCSSLMLLILTIMKKFFLCNLVDSFALFIMIFSGMSFYYVATLLFNRRELRSLSELLLRGTA
jgi:PST family polysaccharide transporter